MTHLERLVYDALYAPYNNYYHPKNNSYLKSNKNDVAHSTAKTTDTAYVATRVIPGVRREDVKVSVEGNTLRVDTKSNTAPTWAAGYANTSWTYLLHDDADVSATDAKLVDGILTITVPRVKPTRTVHNVTVN
jgi:HSP20 family molecular chaperone IbpA